MCLHSMIDGHTICIQVGGMFLVPCEHSRINIGGTIKDAKPKSVIPFFSDILRFPFCGKFVACLPVWYLSVKDDVSDALADSDFCEFPIIESQRLTRFFSKRLAWFS